MIKAILIDDEPHCTKMLSWEIENHCPDLEIAAICHSGQEGIQAIRERQPDIVFLDIEMPSMNGFEMLSRLDKIDFDVIFTTAYDHFAIKAIRISALDYLLKPVNNVELKAAVAKHKERSISNDFTQRISLLFDQIRQPETLSPRIALTTHEGIQLENIADVVYFKADGNYSEIILADGRKVVVSKTLKHFEESLEGYDFIRVHHSYYINVPHVRKYVKQDGGQVLMSDGSVVPVSRRRKDDLLRRLATI